MCNMPPNRVQRFNNIVFYIIDDIDRGGNEHRELGDRGADEHRRKCNEIHDLFKNHFQRCQIISVRMLRGQLEMHFTKYFRDELRKYTSNDLVIFYFHGAAGEVRQNYTWYDQYSHS